MSVEATTTNPVQERKSLGAELRQLGAEILAAWAQFPHRELFWGLLGVWILLFHLWGNSTLGYIKTGSLLGWMVHAYEWNPEDQHGFFIPLLVLVLLWWKREELLPLPKAPWWPGLGLLGLAAGLHLLGYLAQQARISIVGFYLGIYAITGMLWGWRWLKATAFPFCLFIFCVPVASQAESLTFPLRLVATQITVWISHHVLGVPVIQNGVQIFDPAGRFQYEIAAACSGIKSLTALTVLTMIYGFMFFQSFWQRAVILLVAIPAAIVSNVLRLVMIVVAAELFGQAGGNYVHDSAWLSLLPYVVGFAMVYVTGRLLTPRRRAPAAGVPETA
ncbi:MAG: exosortase/archaeosortase family protein [Verrucomicrobiae bacterium]|nr:exosortase/archaeosortase family protein [Verrucomicrobiae bacterium]